jgi:hypothetical protein
MRRERLARKTRLEFSRRLERAFLGRNVED